MANYTTTLKDVANNSFLPETAIRMVFDDNNNSLSSSLTAADINVLEGGKINTLSSSIASMSDYVTAEISDLSSVASGAASTAAWAASAATSAEGSLSGLNTAIASVASLASGNASDISTLITNKANKASSSANGNLAKFKADGNLEDTGIASTTIGQLQSGKADLSYVNGMKLTKVWENPSPTADFGEQEIEINGELHDLVIFCKISASGELMEAKHLLSNNTSSGDSTAFDRTVFIPSLSPLVSNYLAFYTRRVTFYITGGKTKVKFYKGYLCSQKPTSSYEPFTYSEENDAFVPVVIYKVGNIYNS